MHYNRQLVELFTADFNRQTYFWIHSYKIIPMSHLVLSRFFIRSAQTINLLNRHLNVAKFSTRFTVIGGTNLDQVCVLANRSSGETAKQTQLTTHSDWCKFNQDNPCQTIRFTCGGVARNISEVLYQLRVPHKFLSAIGGLDDTIANQFLRENNKSSSYHHRESREGQNADVSVNNNLAWSDVRLVDDMETSKYVSIFNSHGDYLIGFNIDHCHNFIDEAYLNSKRWWLSDECTNDITENEKNVKSYVIIDANISVDSVKHVLKKAIENGIRVIFEPTDASKCMRLYEAAEKLNIEIINDSMTSPLLYLISPNIHEFRTIIENFHPNNKCLKYLTMLSNYSSPKDEHDQSEKNIENIILHLLNEFEKLPISNSSANWIIKLGPYGVAFFNKEKKFYKPSLVRSNSMEALHCHNVNGAGDSLVATALTLKSTRNQTWPQSIDGGLLAAKLSMQSNDPISKFLQQNFKKTFNKQ